MVSSVDIVVFFIAMIIIFILYIRGAYTGKKQTKELKKKLKEGKLNFLQRWIFKYAQALGHDNIVVSIKQRWYVVAMATLIFLMHLLSFTYIIYFILRVKKLLHVEVSLEYVTDIYNIFVQLKKSYLFIYTFLIVIFGMVTTYAYMITADDCETSGIRNTAELWMGDTNNILQFIVDRWSMFALMVVLKPILIKVAMIGIDILKEKLYIDKK